MDAEIAWYLGALLMAWSVGFCAGLIHKAFLQVAEQAS